MSSNGAQLIIRLLEERGVDLVAGMPGGAVLPLYEALDGSRIRHVLARHEQAAGSIAQGIARIRGRAGVCFVTSGPGVTNVVTALADARLDSVPLVCIAGQVPTHLIGTDAFQEVDATRMAGPVTKARYCVASAARIPAILAEAFDTAEQGRPGPVLIDIPKNVQSERMEEAAPPAAARAAAPAAATPAAAASTAARSRDYDRAVALIAASERPLLYLGGGVIRARAAPGVPARRAGRYCRGHVAHGPRHPAARACVEPRHARHARRALHESRRRGLRPPHRDRRALR